MLKDPKRYLGRDLAIAIMNSGLYNPHDDVDGKPPNTIEGVMFYDAFKKLFWEAVIKCTKKLIKIKYSIEDIEKLKEKMGVK